MSKIRFQGLDVYRGLAIIAVVLNHLPPVSWGALTSLLTGNGRTGVTALFLLSGFLITHLYPTLVSKWTFWFYRLARLIPPFITMVIALTWIRGWGRFPLWQELSAVLISAIFVNLIWRLGLSRVKSLTLIAPTLAIFWLGLQSVTALVYVFWLQRIPAAIFYRDWSSSLIWIITGIINATLTLPFGQYVGQLDGVYWSLPTEYLFYLLYPVLFIPLLNLLKRYSHRPHYGKILLLFWLASAGFSYGLDQLAQTVLSFRTLELSLFLSFITGALIGSNFDYLTQYYSRLSSSWRRLSLFLSLIVVIIAPFYGINYLTLVSLPLGVIVIALVTLKDLPPSPLNYFLQFTGKISYSLYLTHSLVIDWIGRNFPPTIWFHYLVFCLLALVGSWGLAYLLYWLTEKPYTLMPKVKSLTLSSYSLIPNDRTIWLLGLSLLFLLYFGYRPPLSFFTTTTRHRPASETLIKLTEKPITFTFNPTSASMGMITTHLTHRVDSQLVELDQSATPSSVLISLYRLPDALVSQKTVIAHELYDSPYHPLGFPLETNSQNQTYRLEISYHQSKLGESVTLNTSDQAFISVYFPDKKPLLSHPYKLATWLWLKIIEPLTSQQFWLNLVYFLPLFLYLIFLRFISGRKNHSSTASNSLK